MRLVVATPTKIEFDEDVESIIAPAYDGYLGVLPGHVPLITMLRTGVLTVKNGRGTIDFAVSEGYMEVTPGKVVVLAEAVEMAEEIDVERALEAKRRAEELLSKSTEHMDYIATRAALERALNRLKVAKQKGPKDESGSPLHEPRD
ncbi:MAG: F0F1 ATP synthase subunit epsilon [Firmicutes bacterium]|nr:F0F1 ATP synthase subunit epsilon [Bacillota bacterium]